jgi:ABC-type sulfate transport system permease subunit
MDGASKQGIQRWQIGLAVALVLVLVGGVIYFLASNPVRAQVVRDLFIIFIALAVLIVGVLVVLPLVHVFWQALSGGLRVYWDNLAADPDTRHAIVLTLLVAPMAVLAVALRALAMRSRVVVTAMAKARSCHTFWRIRMSKPPSSVIRSR